MRLNNQRRRVLHPGQNGRVELGATGFLSALQSSIEFQQEKRSARGNGLEIVNKVRQFQLS
jgi:hypothetical protein